MTSAPAFGPSFDFGRVIGRMFGVLGRRFALFAGLALLLVGLPAAVTPLLQLAAWEGAAPIAGAGTLAFFSGVLQGLGGYVLQAAVIHLAVNDLAGRPTSFTDSLAIGLRFFLPLIGIGIVSGVGIMFGLLVFFAPGVILGVMWCVAAPVEVSERRGVFGSLGRSADLTRGCRWAIFGLGIIWLVAITALQGALGTALKDIALATDTATTRWAALIATPIVGSLNGLLGAVLIASIYYELRTVKEGLGAEALAAVFD